MSKLTILAAFGAGYVLGAKAGRDRYEEIMRAAGRVKNNPQVQKAAEQASDTVRAQAPVVAEKVKEAAGQATGAVKDKVEEVRSDDDPTTVTGGQPPAGQPPVS